MNVKRYKKRPITVEAVQLTKDNKYDVANWCIFDGDKVAKVEDEGLIIETLEGDHLANINDYVIKGVQGEFYPVKPDIFEATYTESFKFRHKKLFDDILADIEDTVKRVYYR